MAWQDVVSHIEFSETTFFSFDRENTTASNLQKEILLAALQDLYHNSPTAQLWLDKLVSDEITVYVRITNEGSYYEPLYLGPITNHRVVIDFY